MMVGNVTPEASHSIIGTLSAKPVSMETRASNIDFKALLELPIGSQRPVLNSTGDDVFGGKSNLFSLEDLIGSDGRGSTVLDSFGNEKADPEMNPLVKQNITAEEVQNEFNDIAAGLSLEPFFVPVVQNKNSELPVSATTSSDGVGSETLSSVLGPAVQASASENNTGVKDSELAQKAKEILKPLLATNKDPSTSPWNQSGIGTLNLSLDGNKLTERFVGENRQTDVLNPTSVKAEPSDRIVGENRQQDGSNPTLAKGEASDRFVGDIRQRNIATDPRLVKTQDTVEDLTRTPQNLVQQNISSILSNDKQRRNANSNVLDSIDLRLAHRPAGKPATALRSNEVEIVGSSVSVEKRSIGDIKNTDPVFDSVAFSNTLEKNSETPTTLNPLTNLAQPTTQKPVSFDWNAPRFAERFAAEVSGMSVDGDSKKFEINPRNLGRLEVSFVARGSSEVIRIETESDAARDAIIQNSQAIQEMLKAQGRPDLTIRVDVRDAAFAPSQNGNLNLAQQDSAAGRENGSNTSTNSDHGKPNEGGHDPETDDDNGRYA